MYNWIFQKVYLHLSMIEIRKISELIQHLKEIEAQHGDIHVCHSEGHEYWGSVESWLTPGFNLKVKSAQPDGPKSGKSAEALIFG